MNLHKKTNALRLMLIIAILIGISSTQPLLAADDEATVAKVVYHADFADPARISAMLTNIFNMTTTYENDFIDYDIRIVFNAHGIRFLTTNKLVGTPFEVDDKTAAQRKDLITRMQTLHNMQNINLSLCNITREAINLDKEDLIPGVTIVTSGVVEVAKLQSQGFAYLKVQ